jgi:hypothetical protein
MLELKNEWGHFKSEDYNLFWCKLNEIQSAIDNPDALLDYDEKKVHHISE